MTSWQPPFSQAMEGLLDGFVAKGESVDVRRRVYLLILVSLLGIANLLPLGILALIDGNTGLGILDLALGLFLFLNLLHARSFQKHDLNIAVGVLFTGLLFVFALVTGGVDNTGFVWYFTFPLIALYTLGTFGGVTASVAMLLPALALFMAKEVPQGLADYSSDFKLRFLPSYLVVLALSYLFERSRRRFQAELARYNAELRSTVETLRVTEGELRHTQRNLEQRVADRTEELVNANAVLENEVGERKRTEKNLEFANLVLRTQQETSLDGVLVVDAEGKIISYNHRFQEIWKIPDRVLAERSDEEALAFVLKSLRDPDEFLAGVTYLYSHPQETSRDELSLIDGRILDRYSAPMIGSDGSAYGRVWYFRDITENRQSTEALRESEARHRAFIAQATDSIFILDPSGPEGPVIVEANEKACEEHGYTMEELIGMPIGRLSATTSPDLIKARVSSLMKSGSIRFEVTHVRKDGSTFPVEVSSGLIHFGGRPHLISIDRNITDRMAAEKVREEAKQELERQNRELKKVDRMKDALISDVSHELKTPVAKLTMQLEILRGRASEIAEGEVLSDALDVMESTLSRQQNVIRNILMVSRLTGEADSGKMEEFRLDTLLEDVLGEFQPVMARHGIEIEPRLDPLPVRSDRDMLWHVYSNILGNAVKYRCADTPVIKVTLKGQGSSAVTTITDNGVGLTPEERQRAFERFYQASPSMEGIGLGLHIAHMIVESYGGKIEIESEGKGCGASVRVELPRGPR